jgi:hypothetical protein
MKASVATLALCFAALAASAAAAEPPPPKQATPEEIKARLAEHTKKKAAEAAEAAKAEKKDANPAHAAAPVAAPGTPAPKPAAQPGSNEEAPTVLPKVEVRREKVTELDEKIAKQNEEIYREKKNTKPTPLDETLNGPGVSKALAIFGGQSSDDRANVAKERVAMMEEERDLIEAIAQAQTKEEKAELEKTLADMRAMRRELEQSLR